MKLFIGCSSSNSIPEKYMLDCHKYLQELFIEDNELVFGADNCGLMGLSYTIAREYNRDVIGICPEIYKDDFKKLDCSVELTTKTVGDRTNQLIENSDALIFLPGGVGTIYEFFTAIESKRSHEHNLPVILYNSCGYFDQLFMLLDKIYDENFTGRKVKDSYYVSNSAEDTLDYLRKYYDNQYEKKLKK